MAVQTCGRSGTGTKRAREQQAGIIKLLLERGAELSDTDGEENQSAKQRRASGCRTCSLGDSLLESAYFTACIIATLPALAHHNGNIHEVLGCDSPP